VPPATSPCAQRTTGLRSRLHRARDAIRSKPSPEAVRGDRKVEGGTSAEAGDESATGSVNLFLALVGLVQVALLVGAPPCRCVN
jgi:hypothetical protein